jgi:hypothetical protein
MDHARSGRGGMRGKRERQDRRTQHSGTHDVSPWSKVSAATHDLLLVIAQAKSSADARGVQQR